MRSLERRRFYIDVLILMEQLNSFDKNLCNIGELLDSLGYKKIAIYGMGEVGHILFDMLKSTQIDILYVVDNKLKVEMDSAKQIAKEELYEKDDIDAIVVTPLVDYSVLEKQICENCDIPVIGMDRMIEILLVENRRKRRLL